MNRNLIKWMAALTAAAILAGCGGSSNTIGKARVRTFNAVVDAEPLDLLVTDSVLFGANVSVRDHDHGFTEPRVHRLRQPLVCAPVEIGDFVWAGQNAVILKGVTLGDHVVVGANAVVSRSFPPWAIVGGVPARQIGWADGRPFGTD